MKLITTMQNRQQQREAQKKTLGYKLWSVGFAVFYPVIAVFTFLFSSILQIFSWLSQGLVWILKGGKK